jgi:hypothetical protein
LNNASKEQVDKKATAVGLQAASLFGPCLFDADPRQTQDRNEAGKGNHQRLGYCPGKIIHHCNYSPGSILSACLVMHQLSQMPVIDGIFSGFTYSNPVYTNAKHRLRDK